MIYLDHGATSFPKAPGVSRATADFLKTSAGNPGRGGHRLTVAASRAVEEARESIAELLGGDPERTLLGAGATFWLNTLLADQLGPEDRVVVSALEHNAVMRPLHRLRETLDLEVRVVEGNPRTGVPQADEVRRAVAEAPTKLVLVTHASNVSGAVVDVTRIARAAAPTPVVVDGAQTAGSIPLRFADSGLAAFVCSGHKGLLGPTGTGVLMLAPGFAVEPLILGGTGSRSESEDMPEHLPDRLEAGTPNGAGIVGLGEACRWLQYRGIEAVAVHEAQLRARFVDHLRQVPRASVVGDTPDEPTTGVVSFVIDGVDSGEAAARLDREWSICVRAGLHCAPCAHRRLGTFPSGTIRVGFGPFSRSEQVDALVAALGTITA